MKRVYRRHPHLRVVQHDKPEMLRLHPAIERELKARAVVRRGCALAAFVAVLGLTWLLAVAIVAVAKWFR